MGRFLCHHVYCVEWQLLLLCIQIPTECITMLISNRTCIMDTSILKPCSRCQSHRLQVCRMWPQAHITVLHPCQRIRRLPPFHLLTTRGCNKQVILVHLQAVPSCDVSPVSHIVQTLLLVTIPLPSRLPLPQPRRNVYRDVSFLMGFHLVDLGSTAPSVPVSAPLSSIPPPSSELGNSTKTAELEKSANVPKSPELPKPPEFPKPPEAPKPKSSEGNLNLKMLSEIYDKPRNKPASRSYARSRSYAHSKPRSRSRSRSRGRSHSRSRSYSRSRSHSRSSSYSYSDYSDYSSYSDHSHQSPPKPETPLASSGVVRRLTHAEKRKLNKEKQRLRLEMQKERKNRRKRFAAVEPTPAVIQPTSAEAIPVGYLVEFSQ